MSRGFLNIRVVIGIFSILVLLILAFALSRAEGLIFGPQITLGADTPRIEEGMVTIAGTVERVAHLTINGDIVRPEQNGAFETRLFMTSGHTIMTVRAEDRFGRATITHIPIYTTYGTKKEGNNQDTDEESSGTAEQGGEE